VDVSRIEVEIEELVLRGFDRVDGRVVADALERSLAERLADVSFQPGARERLDAGSFAYSDHASPGTIGEAVAGRLQRSLGS
jgi:hypothetical protein